MVDAIPVKNRIIEIINTRGPSLPIQLAKATNMNSLFISAFLSELYRDKRVKMSSLKVGGTPLYFLEGQEEQLEKFYNYLHPKEAEAFLMLKQNKILKDSEQDPAIRVALRSIKDFAVNFRKDNEIYWRYLQFPESEVITLLSEEAPKEIKKLEIEIQKEPEEKEEAKLESSETELPVQEQKKEKIKKRELKPIEQEQKEEFQNPLVIKTIEKPKKEKEKSEFVLDVIKFMEKNNFEILEEKEFKAKEYNCIVKINSDLGPINFLTQAKEKKSISDSDLKTLLSASQTIPISALMLYTGELNKKAKEYAEKYPSILKTKKII